MPVSKWEWQLFPYTGAEWRALFQPESAAPIAEIDTLYSKILYQPLDGQHFLLLADGDLLIVELSGDPEKSVWSVYSLINETNMGVAQWEYAPALSSRPPAFRFEFGIEGAEISASCTRGELVEYDAQDAAAPTGSTLTLQGSALYWNPADQNDSIAEDTAIYFTGIRESGSQFAGTIYITAGGRSGGRTVYTAALVGTGLHLSPNPEGEGGTISMLTTDAGVTEYDLRNGSLALSPGELSRYVFFTNSEQIVVTVNCDDGEQGTVILRDISQGDCEIQRSDVDGERKTVEFTGLTASRLYRIEYDGAEHCTVVVGQE